MSNFPLLSWSLQALIFLSTIHNITIPDQYKNWLITTLAAENHFQRANILYTWTFRTAGAANSIATFDSSCDASALTGANAVVFALYLYPDIWGILCNGLKNLWSTEWSSDEANWHVNQISLYISSVARCHSPTTSNYYRQCLMLSFMLHCYLQARSAVEDAQRYEPDNIYCCFLLFKIALLQNQDGEGIN